MSDYTPTTADVRLYYAQNVGHLGIGGWAAFDRWLAEHDRQVREQALRAAAEKWKPSIYEKHGNVIVRRACPTCEGPSRETVGLVCQTCGKDYGGDPS